MNKFLLIAATVSATVISTFAASPAYKTLSGYGNAASPASVVFPEVSQQQIRIVNLNYASDTNNGALSISDGGAAFRIIQTNAASSSVTNLINSTNGLSASSTLLLNHAGVYYAQTISTFNSSSTIDTNGTTGVITGGTNVVLSSGGWGVATSIGDPVYLMNTPVTLPVGATTNAINGEAIFVSAMPGRPVRVVLTPALSTNKLNSAVGRYE